MPFRYCLDEAFGPDFLHWRVEQQARAEEAIEKAMGLYRTEKARREALEGGRGLSLGGWLGVAGGVLLALGTGFLTGWLWAHFTPRQAVEVPR